MRLSKGEFEGSTVAAGLDKHCDLPNLTAMTPRCFNLASPSKKCAGEKQSTILKFWGIGMPTSLDVRRRFLPKLGERHR
jgi:hypothetical protein